MNSSFRNTLSKLLILFIYIFRYIYRIPWFNISNDIQGSDYEYLWHFDTYITWCKVLGAKGLVYKARTWQKQRTIELVGVYLSSSRVTKVYGVRVSRELLECLGYLRAYLVAVSSLSLSLSFLLILSPPPTDIYQKRFVEAFLSSVIFFFPDAAYLVLLNKLVRCLSSPRRDFPANTMMRRQRANIGKL